MKTQIEIGRAKHRSQVASVVGWEDRFAHCIYVKREYERAREGNFELLYRGTKNDPTSEIFTIGLKAKPFYFVNQPSELNRHAKWIINNTGAFNSLATAFSESRMGSQRSCASADDICQRFNSSPEGERFRLAEILLYSLQYQNSKISQEWSDKLLLLSASLQADVAMRYALGVKPKDRPVSQAFLIEYAPPRNEKWFELVSEVIAAFEELGLGSMFPDKDEEAFVPFAIFPHYVLGYAELNLCPDDVSGIHYRVSYHHNPRFIDSHISLDSPPDLTSEQTRHLRKLDRSMSFVWRVWNRSHSGPSRSHISGSSDDSTVVPLL